MNLSEYRRRVELHAARQGHLLGDWEDHGVARCALCGGTAVMWAPAPPAGTIYPRGGDEGWEAGEYPVCGGSQQDTLLARIKSMAGKLLRKAKANGHKPNIRVSDIETGVCVDGECDECGASLFHIHYDGELEHDSTDEKC